MHHRSPIESILMVVAAILIITGLGIGWFCYSRASPDAVDQAAYAIHAHSLSSNIWILGAIVGLVIMLLGMLALFVSLAGVHRVQDIMLWYKTIFGDG